MKKIAIIGSPGAGKSTLAARLGRITGIEVIHLDRLYWKPGWVETPRDQWMDMQREVVARKAWIIDGNYGATLDIRLNAADTVIFLDLPRRVCLWRALKRVIQYWGRTRPDLGEDCPERLDIGFLYYIWRFRRRQRPKILERLEAARLSGKQVIRLSSHKELETFLTSLETCLTSSGVQGGT